MSGRTPPPRRPAPPRRRPTARPARPTARPTARPVRRPAPARPARARRTRRPSRLRRGSPTFRLHVGFVFITMVLSLFGARLVQLQGVDPGQYAAMAAAEGKISVVLPAERGEILDRNGEPLADSVDGLMVIADPSLTTKKAPALASLLSRELDLDYFTVLDKLRTPGSRFQYIDRQVPAAEARDAVQAAKDQGLVGLYTRDDPVREYPAGAVGANVVGFLGAPDDDGSARPSAGLETAFNTYLSGHNGEARYQVGASGSQIPLGDNTVDPARDGRDLTLTLDRDLQWYCQQVLADAVRQAEGDSGTVVVGDSRTGEILCLADFPTYDASRPDLSPEDRYGHPSLSEPYEPGSVEKALTMAALIDAGKVTSRTRFEVPSVLLRQDRPIHDYFEHGTLRMTLAGILAKSSNIGTVMAADEFDRGELRRYLTKFGLGSRTDLGLGGETPGILPDGAAWTSQTGDRIAFGQSLSVNAAQMWAAINTLANKGERVDPSLVKGTATLEDGTVVGSGVAERHRVVSEDAARQTAEMMERVIDPDAGVAPGAAVPGYRVAGKTGTAQRVVDGVYDGSFSVSFAGFAPADDPKLTAYVVIHNPRNGGGGGSVGGPAFSKVMGYALRRYGVPPTGTPASDLPTTW